MGTFLLLLIAAGLAYVGYQLRRLIGFIEARQPAPPPKPPRFARLRARMAARAYVPLTNVSIPGSVALVYSWLLIAVGVVWVLSALINAH